MKTWALIFILLIPVVFSTRADVPRAFDKYQETVSPEDERRIREHWEGVARNVQLEQELERIRQTSSIPEIQMLRDRIDAAEKTAIKHLRVGRILTLVLACGTLCIAASEMLRHGPLYASCSLQWKQLEARPLLIAGAATLLATLLVACLCAFMVVPLLSSGWRRLLLQPVLFTVALSVSPLGGWVIGKTATRNWFGQAIVFAVAVLIFNLVHVFVIRPIDPLLTFFGSLLSLPFIILGAVWAKNGGKKTSSEAHPVPPASAAATT